MLYNLATFESPFVGRNLITLGISIVNKIPKPIPSSYSKRLSELIIKLLEKRPIERPSIADVMQFLISEGGNLEIDEMSTQYTIDKSIEPLCQTVNRLPRPTPCKIFNVCFMPEKPKFHDDYEEEKIILRPSTQPGRSRTAALDRLFTRRETVNINTNFSPVVSHQTSFERQHFMNLRHSESEDIKKKTRKDPLPVFARKTSNQSISNFSASQSIVSNIIDKRLEQAPVIIKSTTTSLRKPISPPPEKEANLKPLLRPQTSNQQRPALPSNFMRPKSAVNRDKNILFSTPALKTLVKNNANIRLSLSIESANIKKKPSIIDLKCV